ncbi:MAG: hypothetical protein B0W54_00465 [Cellvibrio sp. 79]|nr:MAG: hypothetical protein B0W54_00465 [Cellvibrio sp. 79]
MIYPIRKLFSKNRLLKSLLGLVLTTGLTPVVTAQTQTDILGFESTQYWSANAGTVASTNVHSQGNNAIAIGNFSYVQLSSAPLSTLSNVSQEFEIDVQLPAVFSWGQVQLSVSSPTLGFYSTWVGSANLSNLSANTFHKLTIPIPANIETALKQNYSDLVIKLVLSVPTTSNAVIVDNLRFSGQPVSGCQSNINLVVSVEGAFNNDTLNNLVCTFHTVYPQLFARFNQNAPQTVYLDIRDIDPPAYAGGDRITVQRQWMLNNPHDTDIMVHEGMHIIQGYSFGNVPGWLTEGIADFVRNEYGLSNIGWSLQQYRYGQHYSNGYGVAASFLQWIEANYAGGGSSRVDQLDQLLRSGQYTNNIWVQWTGYDVDHLWYFYSVEKGALYNEQPAPLPATQGIVVYEHANFGGLALKLDVGEYRPSDLTVRGAPGSWFDPNSANSGVSSITVPAGYRVTLYTSSDLSGAGVQYTSDISYVGALNDNVHSIKVELIQ